MLTFAEILKNPTTEKKLRATASSKKSFESLKQSFLIMLSKDKKLQELDTRSLMECFQSACKLDLSFGAPQNECYIFPRGKTATLYVGYKGLIKIAFASNLISSLYCDIIYCGDDFLYYEWIKALHRPQAHRRAG